MIFVTVGTHYLGFERLIKQMDEISAEIDEEVVAQIGSTNYQPKNMTYFTFTKDEMEISKLYKDARVIVAHGGAGTLLTISNYDKPVVIVPRLKKFNEHIDDHQLELTEIFKNEEKAEVVYDIKNLKIALKNPKKINCKKNKKLAVFLKDLIRSIEDENLHGNINPISSQRGDRILYL
jgi:beta-1,4-N-acetylglucosaminyltransferase